MTAAQGWGCVSGGRVGAMLIRKHVLCVEGNQSPSSQLRRCVTSNYHFHSMLYDAFFHSCKEKTTQGTVALAGSRLTSRWQGKDRQITVSFTEQFPWLQETSMIWAIKIWAESLKTNQDWIGLLRKAVQAACCSTVSGVYQNLRYFPPLEGWVLSSLKRGSHKSAKELPSGAENVFPQS